MSQEKLVPKIFFPKIFAFFSSLIAPLIISIDFGYSPLMYKTPSSLPIIYAQTSIPKITFRGCSSKRYLSENAPESPSSALQTTYFFSTFC